MRKLLQQKEYNTARWHSGIVYVRALEHLRVQRYRPWALDETSPRSGSVLEVRVHGKCLVTLNNRAPRQLFQDGMNGVLSDPRNDLPGDSGSAVVWPAGRRWPPSAAGAEHTRVRQPGTVDLERVLEAKVREVTALVGRKKA